ncbi:hypothetical protein [Sinorhizobium fredii]|uniref:hypothetical protein n=1 Tax=Rhizobium fredii TaxID=380 RepID=UPI0012FD363B|nr:hypothetical protein [Sinorhizobium fredii]
MGGYSQRLSVFARLSVAVSLPLASAPPPVFACGYHDDVTMARGLLNWVYPDALHVVGAMSAAVAERRLPTVDRDAEAPDLFGSRYRRTTQALRQLAKAFPSASGRVPASSFSIVLIEPMLWTRFEAAQGGLSTHVHVTGPQPGDLVLVSGEAVIVAVAVGRLTMAEAVHLGLVRLYGSERQKADFIGAYRSISGRSPDAYQSGHLIRPNPANEVRGAAMPFMRPAPMSLAARVTSRFPASEVRGEDACEPVRH